MERTDEQLIAAYIEGEVGAFPIALERHLDGLYRYALRLTGNREIAEDIVQDTTIKAWKRLETFKQGERWSPWLYRIARNSAIDHLRKRRMNVFSDYEREDGENALTEGLSDDGPMPDLPSMREEDKKVLENALLELPLIYREVLHLYYDEDMTLAECAKTLERPLETVKSQHRRAILALRKRLVGSFAPNYQASTYQ